MLRYRSTYAVARGQPESGWPAAWTEERYRYLLKPNMTFAIEALDSLGWAVCRLSVRPGPSGMSSLSPFWTTVGTQRQGVFAAVQTILETCDHHRLTVELSPAGLVKVSTSSGELRRVSSFLRSTHLATAKTSSAGRRVARAYGISAVGVRSANGTDSSGNRVRR